jgi:hypothetical protein
LRILFIHNLQYGGQVTGYVSCADEIIINKLGL